MHSLEWRRGEVAEIKVHTYTRQLLVPSGEGYQDRLKRLADEAFSAEPWGGLAARTALAAGTTEDDASIPAMLEALSASSMDEVAGRELGRLVSLADPGVEVVECHLFPCLNQKHRGGFCYAPGKMLILIPLMELWEKRLRRNITHEYSHTVRMRRWPLDQRHGFGPAFRYTIREHLVFEGLAENLVEQFHADPDFPLAAVTTEEEARFWEAVQPHFERENWDAYGVLMNPGAGLPSRVGYTVGYHLVKRYLDRQGITALAAHQIPYDELYWRSGYPLLR